MLQGTIRNSCAAFEKRTQGARCLLGHADLRARWSNCCHTGANQVPEAAADRGRPRRLVRWQKKPATGGERVARLTESRRAMEKSGACADWVAALRQCDGIMIGTKRGGRVGARFSGSLALVSAVESHTLRTLNAAHPQLRNGPEEEHLRWPDACRAVQTSLELRAWARVLVREHWTLHRRRHDDGRCRQAHLGDMLRHVPTLGAGQASARSGPVPRRSNEASAQRRPVPAREASQTLDWQRAQGRGCSPRSDRLEHVRRGAIECEGARATAKTRTRASVLPLRTSSVTAMQVIFVPGMQAGGLAEGRGRGRRCLAAIRCHSQRPPCCN